MTSTPTACPSCEREQFIGKCPHNREPVASALFERPLYDAEYVCNCGAVFSHPTLRTVHIATCPVMRPRQPDTSPTKADCRNLVEALELAERNLKNALQAVSFEVFRFKERFK